MEKIESKAIKWETRKFPLVVIAENMHSPSNIGMIMRLSEAFGVSELHFTGPYTNQTKKYKKSARSADQYVTIFKDEDTVSVIQSLKARNYKIIGIEICESSELLQRFKFPGGNLCFVLGSERHGISEITMKLLDYCVHIQQYGKLGSINASMALSICLFEYSKQISGISE